MNLKDPNGVTTEIKKFISNKNNRKFYKGYFKANPVSESPKDLEESMMRWSLKNEIDDLMFENSNFNGNDVIKILKNNLI